MFSSCVMVVQDPKEADAVMRVQQDLDETKIVLVRTLFSSPHSFPCMVSVTAQIDILIKGHALGL